MHSMEHGDCGLSTEASPATVGHGGKITVGRMSGWIYERVFADICSTGDLDLGTSLTG